jgi:GH25 family lysozyme M1 (1,4-beta-N-acetylmuramidase)
MFWSLWAARNKTVRHGSRVGLSHSGQYSARGSGPGLTKMIDFNVNGFHLMKRFLLGSFLTFKLPKRVYIISKSF